MQIRVKSYEILGFKMNYKSSIFIQGSSRNSRVIVQTNTTNFVAYLPRLTSVLYSVYESLVITAVPL